MTTAALFPLLPLIVVALGAVIVMLQAAFQRSHALSCGLTLGILACAFLLLPVAARFAPYQATALLVIDPFALLYMGIIFAAAFVVTAMSYGYLESRSERREEYYILLLTGTTGAAVMVAASHFASLVLGVEILSVSAYALVSYQRDRKECLEAGLKYLLLAAASAAFMLFGIALIYAELGSMAFGELANLSLSLKGSESESLFFLTGIALIMVGIGFKLAIVPFHWWTADVYQGAPAPITGFIATVSKGGMFAALFRYFSQVDVHVYPSLVWTFTAIAVVSMLAGNLLALFQNDVKRILAYSSIAHLGYLLVAFLAKGLLASEAAAFYLATYSITVLAAFGVIAVMSQNGEEAGNLKHYRGLFWRSPGLAAILTVALLSLGGMPLTVGFIGKFFVLAAGEGSALWFSVFALVLASTIGIFYYLRVIVTMAMEADRTQPVPPRPAAPFGWSVLVGLTACVVWLGCYPQPFLRLVERMVAQVGY